MDYFTELIEYIKKEKPNKRKLSQKKIELCTKYKRKNIPTDIEIFCNCSEEDLVAVNQYIITKPTRTISGVAVIAVMSKPFPCPHGKCIFCPGGLGSFFGEVPQSYTGNEPSTMRGIRNEYNPYRIVFNRLEQYVVIGQNPEKAEVIIMGGTFISFPKEYKEEFVRNIFKAMNDFSKEFFVDGKFNLEKFKEFFELPGKVDDKDRAEKIKTKVLKLKKMNIRSLDEEKKINETSNIRCVGLTIETKPDWGMLKQGNEMLSYGVTRVELGVQTTYDDVLKASNRGHTLQDNIDSIRILKDLGFKLNFHLMPGLPGVTFKEDLKSMKEIFENSDFRPDMLKIYPTLVMPGTLLYKMYKEGRYKPLETTQAAELIVEAKKYVPRYCRIMRVQRDIPTKVTEAGVDRTNLRQYIDYLKKENKVICQCIRCREIKNEDIIGEPVFEIIEYDASQGKEFFISLKDEADHLLGFTRLRFPSQNLRKEITLNSAIIRELHVYGQASKIKGKGDVQHKGFGMMLVKKAEEIARKHTKNKMVVISGVGVKQYYKEKLCYHNDGPYVSKKL